MRKRDGLSRHERGYIAFSPPSKIAFTLYFAFQKHNRLFDFNAFVGVRNEDESVEQTVDSQFEWQLKHRYCSRRRYYLGLFAGMVKIIEGLKPVREEETLLRASFGPDAGKAQKIFHRQKTRFGSR